MHQKRKRLSRTLPSILLISFYIVAFAPICVAQDRGIQFVGLSNTTQADIDFLAGQINGAGSSVQVSVLPFEFAPGNSFEKIASLIAKTNRSFRITICIKWFPHDQTGNSAQDGFWTAWQTANPTAFQMQIRNEYAQRIQACCQFIATTRSLNGSRIRFTLVPVLEDKCKANQRDGYQNLLAVISNSQAAFNGPAQMRRSCLLDNRFRVSGATLELHGKWSDCAPFLIAGDTWSNDGTNYTWSDFVSDQAKARNAGVSSLWWHELYNGTPRLRDNWANRIVNPFSGPFQQQQRAALREVFRR